MAPNFSADDEAVRSFLLSRSRSEANTSIMFADSIDAARAAGRQLCIQPANVSNRSLSSESRVFEPNVSAKPFSSSRSRAAPLAFRTCCSASLRSSFATTRLELSPRLRLERQGATRTPSRRAAEPIECSGRQSTGARNEDVHPLVSPLIVMIMKGAIMQMAPANRWGAQLASSLAAAAAPPSSSSMAQNRTGASLRSVSRAISSRRRPC